MKPRTILFPLFLLLVLFNSYTLFAQANNRINPPLKDNILLSTLNLQDEENQQNKKHMRLYVALYSSNREFDNSLSVFSTFFNLGEVFNAPFKSLFSTNYRNQNIYFQQNSYPFNKEYVFSNTSTSQTKNVRFEKWLDLNRENTTHFDTYVEMPSLLPAFRNILTPASGLYLGYKF